jgi:hypothetical protein
VNSLTQKAQNLWRKYASLITMTRAIAMQTFKAASALSMDKITEMYMGSQVIQSKKIILVHI